MPRPRRPGAPEPKRRSRKGCWPCKSRKVKCGEEKPICLNCQRQDERCDYSVRLNWGGRMKRATDSPGSQSSGHGGFVIGFGDSAPTSTTNSFQVSPVASNDPTGGFIHVQTGDLRPSGTESPIIPERVDRFDPTNQQQERDGNSPSTSTWSVPSPMTGPSSPGSLSKFPFHGSFSPVAGQGVGLRSHSAFPFHTSSISQQTPSLQNLMVTSEDGSGVSNLPSKSAGEQRSFESNPREDYGHSDTGRHEQSGFARDYPSDDRTSSVLLSSHGVLASTTRSHTISSSRTGGGTGNSPPNVLVESLHSSPQGPSSSAADDNGQEAKDSGLARSKWHAYLTSVTDNYGLDSGRPDLDLASNIDHAAIDFNCQFSVGGPQNRNHKDGSSQDSATQSHDYSEYYNSPVPINIPRSLAPLPSVLLENPINLMYFHHFLNHTSRMLVPHDCDYNPFISVLPSMAIGDPNLLNLMLAYSASHRARYLGHAEPANRIAHWVSDVFPALRIALESSQEKITDGHLATAILLLSLKIVSPGTFEVPITWQSHLKLARDLFLARSEQIAYPGNQIGAFFSRWLGYIDTMGALSSRSTGPPLMLYHSVLTACSDPCDHDEYCVDCFTGFTPQTGSFLIRLAQLVQQCDNQRFDDFGKFRQDWHPSSDIVMEAQAVLSDIDGLAGRAHAKLDHHQGSEFQDMIAIEEGFRFAGLIHLHRRVLGSSTDSYPVQDALRKLIAALGRMRLGASTEVCSLFPLFTAGCESQDATQQIQLLNRFFVLEKSGMKQIQNARRLMQQCWNDKLPWIALASGQFLG